MTAKEIASMLINAGMTLEGACGVLGNWQWESLLQPDNVENRAPYSDAAYTSMVNNGTFSKQTFCGDTFGFGYAQWTYPGRKAGLWDFTVGMGYSIADPVRQVQFALKEFPSEAPDTFRLLKTSNNLYTCTEWVCKYYEKPAVDNVQERYQWALKFYNQLKEQDIQQDIGSITQPEPIPVEEPQSKLYPADMSTLARGFYGTQVGLYQTLLNAAGFPCEVNDVFDKGTEDATKKFQELNGLDQDGIAGKNTFAKLRLSLR